MNELYCTAFSHDLFIDQLYWYQLYLLIDLEIIIFAFMHK